MSKICPIMSDANPETEFMECQQDKCQLWVEQYHYNYRKAGEDTVGAAIEEQYIDKDLSHCGLIRKEEG